jgi:hypothetical protein
MWLGLAWLALVNAALLGGARWNRSRVTREITLSQRELPMDLLDNGSREENGDLNLRLAWRPGQSSPALPSGRATVAQLQSMGIDTAVQADDPRAPAFYGSMPARPMFIALEYDGGAWRGWLAGEAEKLARMESDVSTGRMTAESLQRRREAYEHDRTGGSRLIAVDLDADPAALRARHPGAEFIIWPASVQPAIHDLPHRRGPHHDHDGAAGDETPADGKPFLAGDIELRGEEIHVPRQFRTAILRAPEPGATETASAHPPGYRVTLRIGRRGEPWIAAVEPVAAGVTR